MSTAGVWQLNEITSLCGPLSEIIRNIPSDTGRVYNATQRYKMLYYLVSWPKGCVGLDSRVWMCCRQVSCFPIHAGLPLILWTSGQINISCVLQMAFFLCQDHGIVWTRSRAEGFKWLEWQKNEQKDPDLDLQPAFMPQPLWWPKLAHYKKPD